MNKIPKLRKLLRRNTQLSQLLRLLLLLPLLTVVSCTDELFKSPFAVQFPHQNGHYIGDQITDFIITYDRPITTADIYLNGNRISDEFNYGSSSAMAPIRNIRKYLREGENTLTVDPMAFGPTIKFTADTQGPTIIVSDAKITGSTMHVKGQLRDASDVSSLVLKKWKVLGIHEKTGIVQREQVGSNINIPVKQDKSFSLNGISVADTDIYTFESVDIHGLTNKKEYLANNATGEAMKVSNAMRMAIGDTLVQSLRPFIASSLFNGLRKMPIDIRDACWKDNNKPSPEFPAAQDPNGGFCAADQTGSTFNPGLNPIRMNMPIIGNADTIVKRLHMVNDTSRQSTVLLNDFKIEANDRLYLDMEITDIDVSLIIKAGGILGDLTMSMQIAKTTVDTGVLVQAVNKKMHVEMVNSNFGLQGITTTELKVWGMNLTGIGNAIIPLLEGLIAGMLPDIINPILQDNLEKVVIGAKMLDEDDLTKEYFEYALNVETIKTDSTLGGANEMLVGLETWANVLSLDPKNANTAIGSVYVEDPIDISMVYNAQAEGTANISFALSSNAFNQALAVIFNTGLSHFTLMDGEMFYGADPDQPAGTKDGQTRTRLYPGTPPFFILESLNGTTGGAAAASIGYELATLYLDKFENGQWKNQITLEVDLSIAATIDQEDQIVKLGIHGTPSLNIHKTINNTGLPFTQKMLQTLVDAVFVYFIPSLNQNVFRLDMSQIADQSLNGTRMYYRYVDNTDDMSGELVKRHRRYSFNAPCDGDQNCVTENGSSCTSGAGCFKHVCDTLGKTAYPQQPGKSLVCQTIDFVMSTSTVSSIGAKGSNLFFQMQANERGFTPSPGLPNMDLDGDGIMDKRDNCAVPRAMLEAAVVLAGGLTGTSAIVDSAGKLKAGKENEIKSYINKWLAYEMIDGVDGKTGTFSGVTSKGNYYLDENGGGAVAPAGTAKNPTDPTIAALNYKTFNNRNIVDWWDYMRKGDSPVASSLATDDYPWITMRYNNPSQRNTDGDRVGELCEEDDDRDGVYTDNGAPYDTCTAVMDPSNHPGRCTIDAEDSFRNPVFVLFKNMYKTNATGTPMCITHHGFKAPPSTDNGNDLVSSGKASSLAWAVCNPADLTQRFYVQDSGDNPRTLDGSSAQERIIYIYTNPDKQSIPGFYDQENYHFLATTIANAWPNANSKYWANDDVVVTAIAGYATANQGSWRKWVLSAAYQGGAETEVDALQFKDYPYLVESFRTWQVYNKRNCIFSKLGYAGSTHDLPDVDDNSCFVGSTEIENRKRAAFDILLGEDMTPWRGRFASD